MSFKKIQKHRKSIVEGDLFYSFDEIEQWQYFDFHTLSLFSVKRLNDKKNLNLNLTRKVTILLINNEIF